MDIRQIVRRLEELESEARDKRHYELEDSIGRLIEDIIEVDMEQERQFRKQVSKYIDEKIENEIVKESRVWFNKTSIGSYMSKFEDNGGYYIDGVRYMDCKYTGIPVKNVSEDFKYVIKTTITIKNV